MTGKVYTSREGKFFTIRVPKPDDTWVAYQAPRLAEKVLVPRMSKAAAEEHRSMLSARIAKAMEKRSVKAVPAIRLVPTKK